MADLTKLSPAVKRLFLGILDLLLVILSGGLALLLRFDFAYSSIPGEYIVHWLRVLPIELLITVTMLAVMKGYGLVWHNISIIDLFSVFMSIVVSGSLTIIISTAFGNDLPGSVYFISFISKLILLTGMRASFRVVSELGTYVQRQYDVGGDNIMIVGAGAAGRNLCGELNSNSTIQGRVCCFIDDDPGKRGKYINGVPVVGSRSDIPSVVSDKKISQILVAIPSMSAQARRDILKICTKTGCRVRTLPGLYQLVSGDVTVSALRDVSPEELLGREPVNLDTAALSDFLTGKTVLVTGGGGSIGAELCRQVARFKPKALILLDIYENSAYEVQQELKMKYGNLLNLKVEIASVRDFDRMNRVFRQYHPHVVFHAAAHKHVPLMENNPSEAIKNNIFGTYNTVRAAEAAGVSKFVLISTDKAVNPTSFMGATKRFCELILQSRTSETQFCAVRFGNVLGSHGSVVPLFKEQIARGGPVTLTDKRITRYFMTIPEASQLVLEAGAMARSRQLFVLDMGEPVKILTLAENLIRSSGLTPYVDIDITEIGLRPGEKLYEELLVEDRNLSETCNAKIKVEEQPPLEESWLVQQLDILQQALQRGDSPQELIALLRSIVPGYVDPEVANSRTAPAHQS